MMHRESSYLPCSSYLKNQLFIALELELGLVGVCDRLPGPVGQQTTPRDPRSSHVLPRAAAPWDGQTRWGHRAGPGQRHPRHRHRNPRAAAAPLDSTCVSDVQTNDTVCVLQSSASAWIFILLCVQFCAISRLTFFSS